MNFSSPPLPKDAGRPSRPLVIPVFLPHAGCSHRCVFCCQEPITGSRVPRPAPDAIRNQIDHYLQYRSEQRSSAEIAFFGGNFLGLPSSDFQALLALAAEYVDRKLVDGIRFSTRPDTVDQERLAIIGQFPVTTVELGAQSMDDRVLAIVRRGHSTGDTTRAVRLLKTTTCRIGLQLMIGLPGESEDGSLTSAQSAASLGPDFVRIYPTLVIAGSALARWYNAGLYQPLSLEAAVQRVKRAFSTFRRHGIAVIRMGLQACRELEGGNSLLAGPYHPAFGHLVAAGLFLDAAISVLDTSRQSNGKVRIAVHPRCISRMRGLKNANLQILENRYRPQSLEVVADDTLGENMLRINNLPAVTV